MCRQPRFYNKKPDRLGYWKVMVIQCLVVVVYEAHWLINVSGILAPDFDAMNDESEGNQACAASFFGKPLGILERKFAICFHRNTA